MLMQLRESANVSQALAGLCRTCGLRFLVLCTAAKLFYTGFLVLLKEKHLTCIDLLSHQ